MLPLLGGNLYATAALVGALSFLAVRGCLRARFALLLVAIRVAIPLVYFLHYYNQSWNLGDDLVYAEAGRHFLSLGYSPLSILHNAGAMGTLRDMVNGPVGYGWYNVLAQYLFGWKYSSAVFLNVAVSFCAARLLFELALLAGFSRRYAAALLAFFALQWDVVAWTSFLDVKDILVMTFSLAALYCFARLYLEPRMPPALGLLASLYGIYSLRFYDVALLAIVAAAWLALRERGTRSTVILALVTLLGLLILPGLVLGGSVGAALSQYAPALWAGDITALLGGALHFILNPAPWQVGPEYSFLIVPSALHWIFLVPASLAAVKLWRRSAIASLPILYLAVIVLFYAAISGENGMRFRFQTVFALSWCQFEAARALWRHFAAPAQAPERFLRAPLPPAQATRGQL